MSNRESVLVPVYSFARFRKGNEAAGVLANSNTRFESKNRRHVDLGICFLPYKAQFSVTSYMSNRFTL